MKREELKIKAKELRDKYLENYIEKLIEMNVEELRLFYEVERVLNKNSLSDEEIDSISKAKAKAAHNLDVARSQFYVDNMNNHSSITDFGFDISGACQDMRGLDYEQLRYFLFDKDKKLIAIENGHSRETLYIPGEEYDRLNKAAIDNDKCKYVIYVHNHPYKVCAVASPNDIKRYIDDKKTLNIHGIDLLDSCVVSALDFCSIAIDEEN